MRRRFLFGLVALVLSCGAVAFCDSAGTYAQTNLTSDLPGVAARQDTNLVNPWGLVAGPTTPFWTSDNGTGLSTLYTGAGKALGLVVSIPPANGQNPPSDPTGVVFNSGVAAGSFGRAPFLFATESGTIAAWSGGSSATIAQTGATGSIYKGLALDANLLFAANFGLNRIDVFNNSFQPTSVSGGFTDPNLPAGYAPFNIENINGNLYVAFAKTTGGRDEVDGPGFGYLDEFDTNGRLLKRLVSQGPLNAPWGIALAPSSGFGGFSGDLLVGNFGDGRIDAFSPGDGTFLGTLNDANGTPISIPGLWGLSFGNGTNDEGLNTLYFNAGIPGPNGNVEDHGLFGSVNAVPEPSSTGLGMAGILIGVSRLLLRRRRA